MGVTLRNSLNTALPLEIDLPIQKRRQLQLIYVYCPGVDMFNFLPEGASPQREKQTTNSSLNQAQRASQQAGAPFPV